MGEDTIVDVGADGAMDKHAVAVADSSGRTGEVRYLGEIETTPASVERLVRKLEEKYDRLHDCYEAGPMFNSTLSTRLAVHLAKKLSCASNQNQGQKHSSAATAILLKRDKKI